MQTKGPGDVDVEVELLLVEEVDDVVVVVLLVDDVLLVVADVDVIVALVLDVDVEVELLVDDVLLVVADVDVVVALVLDVDVEVELLLVDDVDDAVVVVLLVEPSAAIGTCSRMWICQHGMGYKTTTTVPNFHFLTAGPRKYGYLPSGYLT